MANATYNANNQLTAWAGTTHTYDNNGNLTGDGTNTYTWNARDQLASMSGGTTASFRYDAFGRRRGKTISGTSTDFLYDGANPVQELSGGTPTANIVTGLGVDQFIARTDSAGARSLLTDGLGSTIALADSAGTLQTQYTYEPFGRTTSSGAASGTSYQYTGRENDGTGLYYYRARYYSPMQQRFISEDLIGFGGGDSNLYSYVLNSPSNFTDSSGLLIDIVVDAAFIGYDINKLRTDGRKNLGENVLALTLDTASALIPGLSGLGPASRVVGVAGKVDDLVNAARTTYPRLAARGAQWHHVVPMYLGGLKNDARVKIEAAYHQLITNEFRAQWRYGQGPPSPSKVAEIVNDVYQRLPLPPNVPWRNVP